MHSGGISKISTWLCILLLLFASMVEAASYQNTVDFNQTQARTSAATWQHCFQIPANEIIDAAAIQVRSRVANRPSGGIIGEYVSNSSSFSIDSAHRVIDYDVITHPNTTGFFIVGNIPLTALQLGWLKDDKCLDVELYTGSGGVYYLDYSILFVSTITDADNDGHYSNVDCNDNDNTVYPGANEKCDGKDNDCNSSSPDGSGESWYGASCDGPDGDFCSEGTFTCTSGTQVCTDTTGNSIEICDGMDNNCDGTIDEGFDGDGDGKADCLDNCPTVANADQKDTDQDGKGNVCDNCPIHANPGQQDTNSDGIGDACTASAMQIVVTKEIMTTDFGDKWRILVHVNDSSGVERIDVWLDGKHEKDCYHSPDCIFNAPKTGIEPSISALAINGAGSAGMQGVIPDPLPDGAFDDDDNDGVWNISDNCRGIANADQFDYDADGVGDACDECDAYLVCGFIQHAPNSPDYVCSSHIRDLQNLGVYYYEVFYDLIKPDGCGCRDDDIDGNMFKKGTVYTENVTMDIQSLMGQEFCHGSSECTVAAEDSCLDANTVIEYSCAADGVGSRQIFCPLGCFDGACETDTDADGVFDSRDNCWNTENPNQADTDNDCDTLKLDHSYWDGQRWLRNPDCGNVCDNCPFDANSNHADRDGDGTGDACDNCPFRANNQDDADLDGVGDACDNCIFIPNTVQSDMDVDGVGNACDNCWNADNPDQADSDNDCAGSAGAPAYWDGTKWLQDPLCGNVCDNCPVNANPDRKDWNNDGTGDACDCNDNFMGPNETAADCGGLCPMSCDDKWTTWLPGAGHAVERPSKCLPVIYNGDSSDKIDIVFVPDNDYNGNTGQFLQDVVFLIESGYFGSDEINADRCKFNFYYYADEGDYQPICQAWNLPFEYYSYCSFADSAAIIFTGGGRACSSTVFSAPPGSTRTIVHETGHKIFGMKDEYCCDGGYRQTRGHPNIFRTLENCQGTSVDPASCFNYCPEQVCANNLPPTINANNYLYLLNLNACTQFAQANGFNVNSCQLDGNGNVCAPNWGPWRGVDNNGDGIADNRPLCIDGGDGWWKADPNTCYMQSGTVFEADCHERVASKLDSFPLCEMPMAGAAIYSAATTGISKVVILKYHIKQDVISFLSAEIAYNSAPGYFNDEGEFTVRESSATGAVLMEASIEDPREFNFDDHDDTQQGMMMGDDLDFIVVMPLVNGLRTISIVDPETQNILHSLDLGNVILGFCGLYGYDPMCGSSDLDADGFPDISDNCPLAANSSQMDSDSDMKGDVCDNCRLVANPDQRDDNSGEDDHKTRAGTQHYGDACDPDFDNDGSVTLADYATWRKYYRQTVPPAPAHVDLDNDGLIGLSDYAVWRKYYRSVPGPGIE